MRRRRASCAPDLESRDDEVAIEGDGGWAAFGLHHGEARCVCVCDHLVRKLLQPLPGGLVVLSTGKNEMKVRAAVDGAEHGDPGTDADTVKHQAVHLGDDQAGRDEQRVTRDGSLKKTDRGSVVVIPRAEEGQPGAAIDEDAAVIGGATGATSGTFSQRRSPAGSGRSARSGPGATHL